jgi:hypothetical protein
MTRCDFGFHDWTPWGKCYESGLDFYQLRKCKLCGKAKVKRVGDASNDGKEPI